MDDGVDRCEPELARVASMRSTSAAAALKLAVSARETNIKRRFITSDLKFCRFISWTSRLANPPTHRQGLVCYKPKLTRITGPPAIRAG